MVIINDSTEEAEEFQNLRCLLIEYSCTMEHWF